MMYTVPSGPIAGGTGACTFGGVTPFDEAVVAINGDQLTWSHPDKQCVIWRNSNGRSARVCLLNQCVSYVSIVLILSRNRLGVMIEVEPGIT